jgi:hypothetical protein
MRRIAAQTVPTPFQKFPKNSSIKYAGFLAQELL